MIRRLLGIAVAILVAALLLLRLASDEQEKNPEQTAKVDAGPDITANDVTFEQLDPTGNLHYRLTAQSISQYLEDRLTRMTAPNIHLTNADQMPWDIESKHGYIRSRPIANEQTDDIVFLRDSVRMVQQRPGDAQVTLRSESFYIYPDRQYAETDQHVTIDTQVGRTSAAGMQADLESGLLTLSSDAKQRVHTIVLPEQFKQAAK